MANRYTVTIDPAQILDADTLVVRLTGGQKLKKSDGTYATEANIRLGGCDAPETAKSYAPAQPGANEATALVKAWVQSNGPTFTLWTDGELSYGRVIGDLIAGTGDYTLSSLLIDQGWAWAPDSAATCDFASYSKQVNRMLAAQQAKKGIWNPVFDKSATGGQNIQPSKYRHTGGSDSRTPIVIKVRSGRTATDIRNLWSVVYKGEKKTPTSDYLSIAFPTTEISTISVSAPGHTTQKVSIDPRSDSPTKEIVLAYTGVNTTTVSFKVISDPAGALLATTLAASGAPTISTEIKTGTQISQLELSKQYTAAYTSDGYAPGSITFVPGKTPNPVQITLVKLTSKDQTIAPSSDKPTSPVTPAAKQKDFAGVKIADYGTDGLTAGWYTASQVKVYIGGLWLDQLNSIQYAVQSNIVPVYGYCSRHADAFAQGRDLVQGQLNLNYTSEWYLPVALHKELLKQKAEAKSSEDQKAEELALGIATLLEIPEAQRGITEQRQLDTYLSMAGGAVVDRAKALLAEMRKTNGKVDAENIVYTEMTFDLTVEFGDPSNKRRRLLEKCRLISNEQSIGQDGNSVLDSYGFIARRVL